MCLSSVFKENFDGVHADIETLFELIRELKQELKDLKRENGELRENVGKLAEGETKQKEDVSQGVREGMVKYEKREQCEVNPYNGNRCDEKECKEDEEWWKSA